MKFHHILILIFLLFFSSQIMAATGDTGYEFLNITPSSHVYGLGGQNISIIDDDINLTYQNPALLGQEMDKQLGINYMKYLGGSNLMGATFGLKAHTHGAFAFGIQYFGYGSMTAADPDGTITGSFSPQDITFNVMYSHDITNNLRGGINVKEIFSTYDSYSAFAICTDLGLNYYNPDKNLSLSLALKNLGGQIKKFDDTYVNTPWDIQLGYTQALSSIPLQISITATNLTKWKLPYYEKKDNNSTSGDLTLKDEFGSNLFRHLTFGIECIPSDNFYIGLGYSYKTRTDMTVDSRNFISGFSIGAGLNVKMLGFGVALAQPHTGGTTFMFNARCNISDLLNK